MVKYLKTEEDFEEEIKDKSLLIDFYADWCGPCQMMGSILEGMNLDIDILKVNTDDYIDLALNYGIMNIPTLIYMKNGDVVGKMIGMHNEEEIKEFINNNK